MAIEILSKELRNGIKQGIPRSGGTPKQYRPDSNREDEIEILRLQIQRRRGRRKKKFGPFLDLCVSSLRRGHANLLCIVPILSDVPPSHHG